MQSQALGLLPAEFAADLALEAEAPPNLLSTHHHKRHRDRGFSTFSQRNRDQLVRILALPEDMHTPSTSLRLRWSALSC